MTQKKKIKSIIVDCLRGDVTVKQGVDEILRLVSVSDRRELLIAFTKEMQDIGLNVNDDVEKVVDIYMTINCC